MGGNEEEGVGEGKDDGNAQDGGKPADCDHHHDHDKEGGGGESETKMRRWGRVKEMDPDHMEDPGEVANNRCFQNPGIA